MDSLVSLHSSAGGIAAEARAVYGAEPTDEEEQQAKREALRSLAARAQQVKEAKATELKDELRQEAYLSPTMTTGSSGTIAEAFTLTSPKTTTKRGRPKKA